MRNSPNLRHIEAFRAVMLAGTVVGAAELMNVTQPAVSRTIALLEMQLGFKLFERRGRRLHATSEAQTLYREVEKLYIGAERIGQIAQDIRYQRAGAIRVAVLPALTLSLIPLALRSLLDARPGVTATVQSLPSRQIAELVSTGQIDVGIVELPVSRAAIVVEPFELVSSVVIMPRDHRLAAKDTVKFSDLHGERMVLLSQHTAFRYQIDDALTKANATPNVVVETASSLVASAMVVAGLGVSIVSAWTARSFASSSVITRPLEDAIPMRVAVIFPERGPISSLARAFADELRKTVSDPRD
ncbi:DNA-binding transcriptional regulator, LysR family [Burkholderia sp. WP9]|uniref:LysR substrate-binding domain-containing protein n=1 Tax=Burkholderia sp. WP9 TaxID=1500263 RepID=UPI00089A9EBB|nr:LysR substrate-binding domain-containing protein [Burkholderia sp. WP9]SEF14163.1 DNA-binding transcriptional regulator, LysR family [Burkholderia sp. WP9]